MERRRYERAPFFADVTLRALPNGPSAAARTLDLSLGGVGLVSGAAFTPGQLVNVVFYLVDAAKRSVKVEVVGRVVNLNAETDANRIGVEFVDPLSASKTPELVNRLQKI
jgi:c-di-GMP-binding flagellar brake protein YcgR